jgi:hypothetical protein
MLEPKIKISKQMLERIKEAAESAGYSSVEELVETALERELERISTSKSPDSEEAVRKQLQGLGYID